ncbi:MAG: YncE family protein, partial [Streptosporangiales bacterium]
MISRIGAGAAGILVVLLAACGTNTTLPGRQVTIYVANNSSGTVTPISTATNTPGPAIKVGSNPQDIAVTPDGKTAYVANFYSGTVTPISTATNTPGPAIPTGTAPGWIAVTPDGKTAYVTNEYSGTVTPISKTHNTPHQSYKKVTKARW